MFLLLHDPFTGRPVIGRTPLQTAVTAAALADLCDHGWLTTTVDARLTTTDQHTDGVTPAVGHHSGVDCAPGRIRLDRLGVTVVDAIAHAPARAVRTWLRDLAPSTLAATIDHATTTGLVHPHRRDPFRRRPTRWPAIDLLHSSAHSPRAALRDLHPAPTRPVRTEVAFAATLAAAVGARTRLDLSLPDPLLLRLYTHLPPTHRALCRGVHAALGARAASASP